MIMAVHGLLEKVKVMNLLKDQGEVIFTAVT
jgi:hypothetical protein